jgi:hypothetical protein
VPLRDAGLEIKVAGFKIAVDGADQRGASVLSLRDAELRCFHGPARIAGTSSIGQPLRVDAAGLGLCKAAHVCIRFHRSKIETRTIADGIARLSAFSLKSFGRMKNLRSRSLFGQTQQYLAMSEFLN